MHALAKNFSHPTSFHYAMVPHGVDILTSYVAGTVRHVQGQARCSLLRAAVTDPITMELPMSEMSSPPVLGAESLNLSSW